ncbi:hypothetical protein [Methylobacterium sp. WSM2598]|uniref:hypothetical protein n=1 Tax=Methylobacterium sp. WSM2598 TaxID=398261 RepID=UPI001F38E107|nr:hypothetical protein [Methylobacterium sp. WSM2598]
MAGLAGPDGNARAAGREAAGWPGAGPAAAVAVLTALLGWFWILPATRQATGPDAASVSLLDEVAPEDLQDAVATLDPSDPLVAQIRQRRERCAVRLAWVSIVRAPKAAAGSIRLRSGPYVSTAFSLPDAPRRVAIPYPAPYEAGRGTLAVFRAGGAATLALMPAWQVPPGAGEATQPVTWRPSARCGRADG